MLTSVYFSVCAAEMNTDNCKIWVIGAPLYYSTFVFEKPQNILRKLKKKKVQNVQSVFLNCPIKMSLFPWHTGVEAQTGARKKQFKGVGYPRPCWAAPQVKGIKILSICTTHCMKNSEYGKFVCGVLFCNKSKLLA